MSVTWNVVDAKLLRLLADDGTLYPSELRIDAFNAALEIFVAHTAKISTFTFTADGVSQVFTLPADIVDYQDSIEGLWDADEKEWIEEIKFVPGTDWEDRPPRSYFLWPSGMISLAFTPKLTDSLVLYYYANWGQIVADTTVVDLPQFGVQACLYYAASYCLIPEAKQAADIRQYATKVDSGTPVMNPVWNMSEHFLKRYQETISRFRPQQKGMIYTSGRAE